MDLFRRYLKWNDRPDIERYNKCPWWVDVAYQPLAIFGIAVFTFNDELRHATMLEF